jgi:hypothetical protein
MCGEIKGNVSHGTFLEINARCPVKEGDHIHQNF